MFGQISPPEEGFNSFILYRAAYSDIVEIVIGQDSYCLHWQECQKWLEKVVLDFWFREKLFNYLFNMRCLQCRLSPVLQFKPFDVDEVADKLVTNY